MRNLSAIFVTTLFIHLVSSVTWADSLDDIKNGGRLHFEMSNQPNKTKGLANADKPFSLSKKAD